MHVTTLDSVYQAINTVKPPVFNYALLDSGIVEEVALVDQAVSVVFAFSFPSLLETLVKKR